MFSASQDFYDLLYDFKDYDAEAVSVAGVIRTFCPTAHTVLDVACGTGQHARVLASAHGFEVDGIDLEPRFIELAQARHPDGRFEIADMRNFHLGRAYDAVISLFSSIGYARDLGALKSTIRCMAEHVAPHGVLMVEPWFQPGDARDRFVSCLVRETPDVTVCRMSHTRVEDRVSRLQFEYLIGTADGLERRSETHELGLFTREEMEAAFSQAGFPAEYDPAGPMGRGLYVARRPD